MGENNRKPHIALYISSFQKGGAQRVMANLAEYLYDQGWKVTAVTTYYCPPEYGIRGADWDNQTGKPVEGLTQPEEGREPIHRIYSEIEESEVTASRRVNFRRRFEKLQNIWKTEKPDIILSFIGMNNIMAVMTSRKLGIPAIVSIRSTRELEYDTPKLRLLSNRFFRQAAGVVFQTRQTAYQFPMAIRKKGEILPNSVNPAFMRPRYEGVREKTIVSVGRLDGNKNQGLLIRAFAAIRADFPAYQLHLYGDGPAAGELQELARELSLRVADLAGEQADAVVREAGGVYLVDDQKPDVIFQGTKNRIAERIEKASVYVLCSNIEGMPNSLIEAMALGLACISTDCAGGGPASLIESGLNGYLIPVGSRTALEAKLRYLLGNPKEIDRIGRNAARVQEDYNPDKINREWEAYLLSKVRS